mgnify:CR=1 FL=1
MYQKTILDNGLRILTETMPHTRSVSVAIFLGAGSRYESEHESGAAHFIEHMLFKGTRGRPNAQEVCQPIEAVGGVLNGGTDKELSSLGRRYLDQLPLTPWQRCYLWTGKSTTDCEITTVPTFAGKDDAEKRTKMVKFIEDWAAVKRGDSPLFKLLLADAQTEAAIKESIKGFKAAKNLPTAWRRQGRKRIQDP